MFNIHPVYINVSGLVDFVFVITISTGIYLLNRCRYSDLHTRHLRTDSINSSPFSHFLLDPNQVKMESGTHVRKYSPKLWSARGGPCSEIHVFEVIRLLFGKVEIVMFVKRMNRHRNKAGKSKTIIFMSDDVICN